MQMPIIKTEAENDRALAIVEDLMHQSNLTPEEDELLNLLVIQAVLQGSQDLTITQVKALADRFQVKPMVFV
jgi:antitoxin component HigA of HigAB toxin-antitoxin module